MGSMTHLDEATTDLVNDPHRLAHLGVQLKDSLNGGILFHQYSESSFVVKVNSKKHLDPLMMELKKSLLVKLNESPKRG